MAGDLAKTVFVSHTSRNDALVAALRQRLESRTYTVLEDSQFVPGDNLPEDVKGFLNRAPTVIAVGSAEATGSHWVKRELRYARQQGKRIIPLLLPKSSTAQLREILDLPEPATTDDLQDWPAELIAIRVQEGAGGLDAMLPALLDALEGRGGGGQVDPGQVGPAVPLADLVLRLRAARFEMVKNPQGAEVRRPAATASLAYYPPEATEPAAESPDFPLIAPLGRIEAADLRFYLERYFLTPYGSFTERARGIEARLPEWGQDLWETLPDPDPTEPTDQNPIKAWKAQAAKSDRRFTVQAPPAFKLRRSATEEEKAAHRTEQEAATELLALPWELLHDGQGYLFHDGIGVRVRRSLPGGEEPAALPESARHAPLRVLAVCARPETDGTAYIDHRVSIQPLTEALNALGDLAEYEILSPPTFPALCDKLRTGLTVGRPFHIVHFDGHGVFDKMNGLGALVFEHPDDSAKLHQRRAEIIPADRLGEELRKLGVGLFFLEACQSAQAEENPEASVAGRLLQSGVASVVAMSHSVLVDTARRFTAAFYPALAGGARVGAAMLAGQRELARHRQRGWGWEPRGDEPGKMQRRPLELEDWFVPVLYQDGADPVLLPVPPPAERVQRELAKDRALATGNLPAPPPHSFVGRSRLLLAAERLMLEAGKNYVVLRGEGGEGKTTLATELARWLVATRRASHAAFALVENLPPEGVRAVLAQWGTQLVPDFAASADSVEHALDALAATLRTRSVVLVLDNMESILPLPADSAAAAGAREADAGVMTAILEICARLCELSPRTRIVFTSREALPEDSPFGDRGHLLEVGRLSRDEGMELVSRVLAQKEGGLVNAEALRAEKEEDIATLVTTVNAHARSLVLLTPELATRGLRATTEEVAAIMADLERRYPGERERSLFASVELSLRRLPQEVRGIIAPLGVVEGGGSIWSLMDIIELEADTTLQVGSLLTQVGLCEMVGVVKEPKRPSDLFLRFDPALAPALLRELREQGGQAETQARTRWAQAYFGLASFLYRQRVQDAHLAAHLTLLELPNLLAALRAWSEAMTAATRPGPTAPVLPDATPEAVIDFATDMEGLLANLGRREALAEAAAIRTRAASLHAAQPDCGLTHAAYLAAFATIERLLGAGRFAEAARAARALVDPCEAAPDDAFPLLAGDRAQALFTLGRALKRSGDPRAALTPLTTARERYSSLAETMPDPDHRQTSAQMASVCLTEQGDCLRHLGELEPAAGKYEEQIHESAQQNDRRAVATGKFQLGTVRLMQRRYVEALQAYAEARETFEALGEPQSVATAWHQIGIVHEQAGNLEEAETAYLRSLSMEVQAGNKPGEASTRHQLGNLYDRMPGRREDAVAFYLQAAEIRAAPATADPLKEGISRSNAAHTLIALGRHAEARQQLQRAIACKAPYGPNAEPWKTWDILHDLETADGNPTAAAEARAQAIAAYAAARRGGWEITQGAGAQLCGLVRALLAAKDPATPPDALPAEARAQLLAQEPELCAQLTAFTRDPNAPPYLRALAPPLLAILDGSRDPALATDPAINYADSVELTLLLEQL